MLDLWILTHRRVGDLEQMRSLASALAARASEKAIVFHSARLAVSLPLLSPHMIDRGRSDALAPPWPDLVLVAEGALGNVALEIGRRSGGRTKVVCLGRPRGRMREFNLIITTPQYRVPAAANVRELKLPLHRLDRRQMKVAAAALAPELSPLPRPWIVLLVGGTSAPDLLDTAAAQISPARHWTMRRRAVDLFWWLPARVRGARQKWRWPRPSTGRCIAAFGHKKE